MRPFAPAVFAILAIFGTNTAQAGDATSQNQQIKWVYEGCAAYPVVVSEDGKQSVPLYALNTERPETQRPQPAKEGN